LRTIYVNISARLISLHSTDTFTNERLDAHGYKEVARSAKYRRRRLSIKITLIHVKLTPFAQCSHQFKRN